MIAGTRGSALAMIQTHTVVSKLNDAGFACIIRKITSSGDSDRNSPIYSMGKVGVFVEELNRKILDGSIDFAVHSAKDIPSRLEPGLEISAVVEREVPTDSLLSNHTFTELPSGSIIGTSSLRRIRAVLSLRSDINVRDIRGNIDTRIGKLKHGDYDGIIVATAALRRLSVEDQFHEFPVETLVPAANQGIIAVVSRKGSEVSGVLNSISHNDTMEQLKIERAVVEKLSLGCSEPVGIIAVRTDKGINLRIRFYSKTDRNFMDFSYAIKDESDIDTLVGEIKHSVPGNYGYEL